MSFLNKTGTDVRGMEGLVDLAWNLIQELRVGWVRPPSLASIALPCTQENWCDSPKLYGRGQSVLLVLNHLVSARRPETHTEFRYPWEVGQRSVRIRALKCSSYDVYSLHPSFNNRNTCGVDDGV